MISFQEWLNLHEAISQEKVREIIKLASEQLLSVQEIAKMVGLSRYAVSEIVKTLPQEIIDRIRDRARERSRERMVGLHKNSEFAAARDARMAKLHQDPELVNKTKEATSVSQEKVREVLRLASEQLLSSREIAKIVGLSKPTVFKIVRTLPPEIIDKIRAAQRERTVERSKKTMARLHQDPEFAAANSARGKETMTDLRKNLLATAREKFWQSQGGFWNWLIKLPEETAIAILGAMARRKKEGNYPNYFVLLDKYYRLRSQHNY